MKVNRFVQTLIPYSSKQSDVTIRLNANETSNYLFQQGVSYHYDVERYPGSSSEVLKKDLSNVFDVQPSNIILGNGSTELLEMCVKTFSEIGDNLLTVTPSFSMYDVYAQMHGRNLVKVSLNEDGSFPLSTFINELNNTAPSILFLCTPNNPTGTIIPTNDILEILSQTDALVIVDEAYMEFSLTETMIPFIQSYPNLLIARTFSKAFGMASARLGYMIGNENTIQSLRKVKLPYSLNEVSTRMGIDALQSLPRMESFVQTITQERSTLYTVLQSLDVTVFPSQANFLYIKTNTNLQDQLLNYGILIRSLGNNTYRITVGTKEQNKQLIQALQEVFV